MGEGNLQGISDGLEEQGGGGAGSSENSGSQTAGIAGETGGKRKRKSAGKEAGLPELAPGLAPNIVNISVDGTPTKEKKRKKKGEVDADFEMIVTSLFSGAFELLSIPLGAHWKVSPDEAALIGKPSARIINRLGGAELAEKYGDYAMLLVALGLVAGPRIKQSMGKRDGERRGRTDAKAAGNETRQAEKDNNNPSPEADTSRGVSGNLADVLPPLA